MTTVQYILIIIAIVIMVVGLYMIIRGILNRKKNTAHKAVHYDKNGIPIIPRHERELVKDANLDEAIEGETTITPDRDHLKPVIEEAPYDAPLEQEKPADLKYTVSNTPEQPASTEHESWQQPVATQHSEQSPFETESTALLDEHDSEDDLFSNLASATESLMPIIETAPEPGFSENSPMLDRHLLAEADQDQNSPLNHAQENINITLVPKDPMQAILGKTILSLVTQYGLKYGAMNMFHRYETKDGDGILWFSMMGITEEGIAPFDLNLLPTSKFQGLVLFLSLPHPKATQGFDSMMSVVNLISNEFDLLVLDENNEVLTRERRQQLRTQVQEYQASIR